MLREVPKDIKSWILFIIGASWCVKLAFLELIDHLYAWVERFHVLFTIKVRSNPRFPFKWVENNGCHNFSRLAPVKLSGFGSDLSFFFFKWLHFVSFKFRRLRFTLSVLGHHGLIFKFCTRLILIFEAWEFFWLRVSKVSFCLLLWNTFALVRARWGVFRFWPSVLYFVLFLWNS